MDAVAADLPLYLQMSRYTKGSKAVMELRTERYLAEQAAETTGAPQAAKVEAGDDMLITGSISEAATGANGEGAGETSEDDGFSFDDFLDMINPLQHLPVVSTFYREMTGDEMEPAARIVGGAIFGGAIGAGVSLAEAVLEQATGDDVGGHVMSLLQGSAPTSTPSTAIAAAPTTSANQPPVTRRVTPEAAGEQPTAPLPTLSAEAFNALLTQSEQPRRVTTPQRTPDDIAAAMAMALDEYDFIKLVDDEEQAF